MHLQVHAILTLSARPGHAACLMPPVGLRHARGRAIAGMDADLQERPRADFLARVMVGVRLVRSPDAAQIVVWGGPPDVVEWRA